MFLQTTRLSVTINLPGDNATNNIHALQVVNGSLYIVAELLSNGLQTGFEVSMFALGGAFRKTVALPKFQDYSFIAGQHIQVADIDDNLIIAGNYGLSPNNILPNKFNGTFIAVFNTTSDLVEQSMLYPQLRQTNPMRTSNNNILIELEHQTYALSISNLELLEPISRFQSIPFSRSNYHQKKHGLISFIEKPPFEALHTQMSAAYTDALSVKLQDDPDAALDEPVDCIGGGTVQQSMVVDEFGSQLQATTFDSCLMNDFSANGVLLQGQSPNCGEDCTGRNKTLRALEFDVTYNSGESWSVDGYISIKGTSSTLSNIDGPIDDPETEYSNLTEINVFSVSDNQLTLNLEPGRYQYDGTLENGIASWMGAGTISYATGISETFSIDLARTLRNGAQVNLIGLLEANRSDGTALVVRADSEDLSSVQYTTTTIAGESVQRTNSW